jgi:UDP-glucose 4-epimerase
LSRIAVAGASGFIGRCVVDRARAAGHEVLPIVRRVVGLAGERVVDPTDADGWRRALDGIEVVAHAAGLAHLDDGRSPAAVRRFTSANVELPVRVQQAAAAAGVERLAHVSSIKALGDGPGPYVESDTPSPTDPYGASKLEAERALLRGAGAIETVIVRPAMVYGPNGRGNLQRLAAAVRRHVPLPVGSLRAARSMVGVDNLVDALLLAAERPGAPGEVFHVADAEQPTARDLVFALGRVLGVRPIVIPAPVPLLTRLASLVGREDDLDRLATPLVVDTSKSQRVLGWAPARSLEAGLSIAFGSRG